MRGRETDRQRNINTDRHSDGHTYRLTKRWNGQTDRQTDREMVSGLRIKM